MRIRLYINFVRFVSDFSVLLIKTIYLSTFFFKPFKVEKVKKPPMYKVLMINDDYTPMEFVVYALENFFNKNRQEATQIMLHIHQKGVGICGVFSYEMAETKVNQEVDFARRNDHPLQCTMEKD